MQLFRSAFAQSVERKNKIMARMKRDENAFISLGPVMGIIGTVILVIIVVLVLAALAPEFFQAVADITGALLSADLNSTLANTIAAIVAILVPLVLLFGFVGLVFAAANSFRRRGGY